MSTIGQKLTQLEQDREDFVDNLTAKGIEDLTGDETFTQLVPRVLDISTGQIIQYEEVPTASEETVGQIIQYIGETTQDYINGYFYKGLTDGGDPATYSWENVEVQKEIHFYEINENDNSNLYEEYFTKWLDDYKKNITSIIVIWDTYYYSSSPCTLEFTYSNGSGRCKLKTSYINDGGDEGYGVNGRKMISKLRYATITNDVITNVGGWAISVSGYLINEVSGLISTTNTKLYTPTGDYNPSTKKYVDDLSAADLSNLAAAYNSTSTYNVGDYVIYDHVLYVCDQDIDAPEAFDDTKWSAVTINEVISNIEINELDANDLDEIINGSL